MTCLRCRFVISVVGVHRSLHGSNYLNHRP
uniref:Uncharacterized protein n=1 Tax=Zea mays TaxID=4577 RepID=C0HGZ6_MAIZE|nr:unknown [Zea mays]